MARRHWAGLLWRVGRLAWRPRGATDRLVRESYDRIAGGYDDAWTNHMRGLSLELVERVGVGAGERCIDLTCGTGFITAELARRSGVRVTGVDASTGMLEVARRQHGAACEFVEADALEFLRGQETGSADVITCGWGLGYTRPWGVVGEAARVLRPGGRLAVIDNSLWSLWRVIWCAAQTFAERPEALEHVMRVRFLPWNWVLGGMMRARGLGVIYRADGRKSYVVASGAEAIGRLTATGAAAGFEFASRAEMKEEIFERFARNIEGTCRTAHGQDGGDTGAGGIEIAHRYLAAIGRKR